MSSIRPVDSGQTISLDETKDEKIEKRSERRKNITIYQFHGMKCHSPVFSRGVVLFFLHMCQR